MTPLCDIMMEGGGGGVSVRWGWYGFDCSDGSSWNRTPSLPHSRKEGRKEGRKFGPPMLSTPVVHASSLLLK